MRLCSACHDTPEQNALVLRRPSHAVVGVVGDLKNVWREFLHVF